MKPRILFVDDERNVLESLKLSLRPMREKWDMSFAQDGNEALAMLARTMHDVVVSDMRMPGIDGAQLLHVVQARHPECLRIILSGYCDETSVFKTVKLAHQYLSKPCRPVELILTVEKALSLRHVLASSQLKAVVSKLGTLPALPEIYSQLVAALEDENATLKRMGDIVVQDVAMTASILRLMNSAFFGLPTRISSIQHAVNRLGAHTLRVLVLSLHLFSVLDVRDMPDFSVKLLWEHSIRVAGFAKVIAETEGAPIEDRDDCFIAGMLHDIGKLVLATTMRREFEEVLARVRAGNCPTHVAEQAVFGTTHAEIGAYLMSLWGFDHNHLESVCWHHASNKQDCRTFSPLLAVHVANSMDHELVRIHHGYAMRPLEFQTETWLESKERLTGWRSLCENFLVQEGRDDA